MEYIALTKSQNILNDNRYIFDANNVDAYHFNVPKAISVSIVFINMKDNFELNFDINEDANVKLSFLQEKPLNLKINGQIKDNSTLTCYYADFTSGDVNVSTDINLMNENAKYYWNLASLSKDHDKKEFDISIYLKSKKTYCEINNYGVARDYSRLYFSGICKIEQGSHESIAHQNSKIMVFDEHSDAIAKPILKIDDNDIEASHAAVVGKISDDHLFYLTSRGLSVNEARELITYGYLKPILLGFDDEKMQETITSLIERGL